MNLTKLFDAQKKLREHINYNGEDRFEKLSLGLVVEVAECANAWRGFKFWSQNQEPTGELLEEYADILHLILEIGIEKSWQSEGLSSDLQILKSKNTVIQFLHIEKDALNLWSTKSKIYYKFLLESYLGLGEMLGFTWEQIEQAYFDKNQINHERQNNGY